MATINVWHATHVRVPHLHVHSPHLEWHELEHPIRAALAALAALAAISLGGAGVYAAVKGLSEIPVSRFARSASEARVTWPSRELPREWRWERKAVSFDHMYGANARGPSVDEMYRKPR